MSTISVTHLERFQFAIDIGPHRIVVDQSLRGGGDESAPSPLDLLGASLGGCIALYVQKFLDSRHVPTGGLRVEVVPHVVERPRRIAAFEVRVILPAEVPSLYRPMVEAVARACPAHNTLAAGASVRVLVDEPALVG